MDAVVELPYELRLPRLVEWPKGSGVFVRLSEDVRRTVVYLGHEMPGAEGEINPCGTGFIVTNGEPAGTYLVTAAHVALDLEDQPFDIRLNQKGEPVGRLLRVEQAKWFYHADEAVDVAVMPFEIPEWADAIPWDAHHFASEFKKRTKNIGAGDFTYVVGILPFMLLAAEWKSGNMAARLPRGLGTKRTRGWLRPLAMICGMEF